ncbi:MAG: metal-sensitive transcriptional regulator [Candidatus Bipolaricaulis sp.]|nr:metal-sensitive transcriptional regulator [Candidatus Bipolaricaulis sp.]MDD5220512.1 metal-sensitive transcriptional regulator [Candidatus Bipolaricaulis sp.]MDD5646466.1 metal-sensitive transcriptional regulator [Candidatus Bipolaricaulis sp.]
MEGTTKGSLAKDPAVKADVLRRLRTASGHLSGVVRMVDDEVYCVDVLKQIAAVQSSLSKAARALMTSHMKHCVREAVRSDGGETQIDEMMDALRYLKHF